MIRTFFEIEKDLDILHLRYSLKKLIENNQIFRYNFINNQGRIQLQQNLDPIQIPILIIDGMDYLSEIDTHYIDIEKDILIQFSICVTNESKFLVVRISDIVIDGEKLIDLFNQLKGIISNKSVAIPQNYYLSDYHKRTCDIEELKKYIQRDNFTAFPVERNPTPEGIFGKAESDSTVGSEYQFTIPNCKELSAKFGSTIPRIMMMAVGILLYRYTGTSYICIDTIVSDGEDYPGQIGLFNNTLLLPFTFNSQMSLKECLEYVNEKMFSMYRYKHVPLEIVSNKLDIQSLPNIRVHFEYTKKSEVFNQYLKPINFRNENCTARQLITFNFLQTGDTLTGRAVYKLDCISTSYMETIVSNLIRIIGSPLNCYPKELYMIPFKSNLVPATPTRIDMLRTLAYWTAGDTHPTMEKFESNTQNIT